MQVGKWGNSLAVRLPAAVVDALQLKEGDEVQVEVADPRTFRVNRDTTRNDALDALRALGWRLPPDFRFSRDEANERGGGMISVQVLNEFAHVARRKLRRP